MLTKADLSEIRKLIREEFENELVALKDELQADINMSRMRVSSEIIELKDRVKNLEIRVTNMHKDLKKEIKYVSHILDKENMQTLKRVKVIEQHIGLLTQ